MLTKEDNEFLTKVGPGTPMGDLLREYWLPALLTSELDADGPVRRIRLLGEDLVAFKDTNGLVGVFEEHCPHRGSSLYLGRNEEGGLRCAYHGWKFNVSGRCVDMPSEPQESNFKDKVHVSAYPTRERNGLVWVYMGARMDPPPLPEHPANTDPARSNEHSFKYIRECNWVQALEGDIDTVHSGFLHFDRNREDSAGSVRKPAQAGQALHVESCDMEWGAMYGAARDSGEGYLRWSVSQFLMPFYTITAAASMSGGGGGKAWIPIDDENTLVMEWGRSRPPGFPREADRDIVDMPGARQPYGYRPDNPMVQWGNWLLRADQSNEWLRDRSLEKDNYFLGIFSAPLQDSAVQVLMGPIADRTKEHLGTTDSMLIRVRRILLQAARELRERHMVPATVDNPGLYRVKGWSGRLPTDADWIGVARQENWLSADGPLPSGAFASASRPTLIHAEVQTSSAH